MNTILKTSRVCACCKHELSFNEFYYNKRTQNFDRYCKECRKKRSRQQRKLIKSPHKKRNYPIITQIEDRELRITLIKKAKETVRASIQRKHNKQRDDELRNFEDENPD